MKIYIIGKNGQLGSDINDVLSEKHSVEGGGRECFDITRTDEFFSFIKNKSDLIINTSAYHNVPLCEDNIEQANTMNAYIPEKMAAFCFENHIKFIHFSTDYVFDGLKNKPYIETDTPNPLNVYGKSKYNGEIAIAKVNPDALIMRISGIYGKNPGSIKGYNFVNKILSDGEKQLKVVNDQMVSPTYTKNIAKQILHIIDKDIKGIIHCADKGEITWYDFAREILSIAGIEKQVIEIETGNEPPKRPMYSVLKNQHLIDHDLDIMPSRGEAIRDYINSI
ncbi:dTDP-4-dehydrorhamnose reductase [candidate division WOR-3 bacterium]|nr:dTDP-4-dehydrorhamnose reductase [candidate division WOR-3 bacterium]